MTEKRWLGLILALFLLLGSIYAVITPVFEASDELWHYPMIRHLADGNPLPVQVFDPAQAGPWKQEASQPPLYYYLGAALTFWIDASDMEAVRLENPHVDNGIITQDGNINLVVHDPAWNPWQGTLLAVRIVRLASVLLGALTVTLTYRIGREVAPHRPEIGLGAAAVNAFTPMFLFISGAVNNDNLAIPLASLAILLMILAVTGRAGPGRLARSRAPLFWLLLGAVIGAAVLTKEGTLGLIPLAAGTAFVAQWQRAWQRETVPATTAVALQRILATAVRGLGWFALAMLPVLLIAGWWYYRNIVLYGDWLGWNAFIAVLGQRAHPASLAQLWGERRGFMMAYWGLFGGVNVPMPLWIYAVLNAVVIAGVAGFGVYLVRDLRAWQVETGRTAVGEAAPVARFVNLLLDLVITRFPLVVALLFSTAVVYGLINWATTTWSSQGRLVFTAISTLCVLLMTGLVGWLPPRPSRIVALLVGGFLLVIAALAPFLWIRPAYDPETYALPRPYVLKPLAASFGDQLELRAASIAPPVADTLTVKPGDEVWVALDWRVLAPIARSWSVFVHLNDPVLGQPIAQRDMYPAQGLRLTNWLQPGSERVDAIRLSVPETAVAPAVLDVVVGLYDFSTFERLPLAGGGDTLVIGRLQLEPEAGALPNPLDVQFEDQLKLAGYAIDPRRTVAGETIGLTLYWQAQQPLDADYTIFAQVVDEDTTRWAAHDFAPPEGTSSWQPGDVVALPLSLPLNPDTPAGAYPVIVGAYVQTPDGAFDRLQIRTADGRLTDDFLRLTLVRVDEN